MSYDVEKRRAGREPITLVELDLDYCQLTYGSSPCTASLGVTGARQCYNTRATCQDPANYDPEAKTYRFCTRQAPLPVGLNAIPSVKSVQLAPTRIEPEGGLGQRASVTIVLQDHSYHDRGIDKYWSLRYGSSDAQELQALANGDALQALSSGEALQARPAGGGGDAVLPSGENLPGTYWGRLRARNPYYLGRVCRIKTGYLTDPVDAANFTTRTYLLESITGPDAGGQVTIKAKDPLKLADNERAVAPLASTGSLLLAIDESVTSATLTPAGVGNDEYPASGWLRLGREVVSFTRSGDALTITRAQFGTTSESHEAGELCQLCLRYAAETVDDILYDLLVDYAGIPTTYIPLSEWQDEVADYLTRTYSTLITEPTGVSQLVKELMQQVAASVWWDERAALIRLRALRAPDPADVLDETAHLLKDSVTVTDKPELRVSEAWVYLGQIDPTESLNQPRNYRQLIIDADLESEGTPKFGLAAIKQLYSRWISSKTVAEELAENLVLRFGETPRDVTFALDAKDSSYWTGDTVFVQSRLVQDADGNPLSLPVQIIEATESVAAHRFNYLARAFNVTTQAPTGEVITISVSQNDANLLTIYTNLHGAPTSTTVVTFVIEAGVIVGQSAATAALDTGLWPLGASVRLQVYGRIQGKGGRGAGSEVIESRDPFVSGTDGGDALLVQSLISVENFGEIWSGGGGGEAIQVVFLGSWSGDSSIFAGGGGAGTVPGQGLYGYRNNDRPYRGYDGQAGTASSGGAGGGPGLDIWEGVAGGSGGAPGLPGNSATPPDFGNRRLRAAGQAGYYVRGNSLVTWIATGDRRGRVA